MRLFQNFTGGTTTDAPLAAAATSFSSAELAFVPEVVAPDVFRIVFAPEGTDPEIAVITDHVASATTATILRGQEGTLAQEWAAGTEWDHAVTADDYTAALAAATPATVEDVATATYTLTADDAGKVKRFTAACTVTLPVGLPVGMLAHLIFAHVDGGTVAGDGTAAVHGAGTTVQHGEASCLVSAADTWNVQGLDPSANDAAVAGLAGRDYRMVAAVIRKTGGVWTFLDDAGHRPLGFSAISADSTEIALTFSDPATIIGSVVATPDETYAGTYRIGASVGSSVMYLRIYDNAGTLVDPTSIADSASGNFWIMGIVES